MSPSMVIVGRKKVMRYVTACITLFNRGEKEILLRARGRSIKRCVDTVMLLRKSFYSGLKIREISIGSDVMRFDGDRKRYVSYMEILIEK